MTPETYISAAASNVSTLLHVDCMIMDHYSRNIKMHCTELGSLVNKILLAESVLGCFWISRSPWHSFVREGRASGSAVVWAAAAREIYSRLYVWSTESQTGMLSVSCRLIINSGFQWCCIVRDHSFQRNVKFWAEPWNLPVSAACLHVCGILGNSLLALNCIDYAVCFYVFVNSIS